MLLMLGVEVGGAHMTVVSWGMVLAVVVAQVATTWAPINIELALAFSILKPIEVHVNRFGSLLFHGSICKTSCGGIIYL